MSAYTKLTSVPLGSDYHKVSFKFREFVNKKGFIEVPAQTRLSILAACEDPATVSTHTFMGTEYASIQSNQMTLEEVILRDPKNVGYFCDTISYRAEPNPVEGRHNFVFPMKEIEAQGTIEDLIELETQLLEHLGFGNRSTYHYKTYTELCEFYHTDELDHAHEASMYMDFGPVVFITDFVEQTHPFWNMKRDPQTGLAKKVDVILCGQETFGSAERSCDVSDMRRRFHTISDGKYADLLYARFTRERVERELEEYFNNKFIPRYGMGIGVTRLIRAMHLENLL